MSHIRFYWCNLDWLVKYFAWRKRLPRYLNKDRSWCVVVYMSVIEWPSKRLAPWLHSLPFRQPYDLFSFVIFQVMRWQPWTRPPRRETSSSRPPAVKTSSLASKLLHFPRLKPCRPLTYYECHGIHNMQRRLLKVYSTSTSSLQSLWEHEGWLHRVQHRPFWLWDRHELAERQCS